MGTDRSFLSLINGAHQYIVAEATRSHSLTKANSYENEADSIYLGVQRLDIYWGVCPNTMKVFTDETGSMEISTGNICANRTRYIIKDLRDDEHYRTCPYVSGFPYMRSYAEVPLISPLGYCIGSICVVDNVLRDFGDETVEILNEVAATIMAHLELVRIKNNRARSEQLVEGLAQFLELESGRPHEIDDDTTSKGSHIPAAIVSEPTESGSSIASRNVHHKQDSKSMAERREEQALFIRPEAETPPSDSSLVTQATMASSVSPPDVTTPDTPLTTPIQQQDEDPFNRTKREPPHTSNEEAKLAGGPSPVSRPLDLNERHSTSLVSSGVRQAISHAAELIRTSMDVDGVSFLDACPSSFASRSNQPAPGDQSKDPFQSDSPEEGDRDAEEPFMPTAVLAHSLRDPDRYTIRPEESQLSEKQLQRLLKKYPQGHIFSADESGPIEERYGPGKQLRRNSGRQHVRRLSQSRLDADQLFRWLPNARFFIFLPLWHFQRECWFSAVFAWIEDSTQAFDMNDLTYLRAFGNSVMTEVSRFETLAVSRAKSDFISSISHELRSPLHGILASAELLRESVGKDTEHRSLLDMIDSCGQTLLDTMNHLLDFAKINNLAKPSTSREGAIEPQASQGSHVALVDRKLSLMAPTNLSTLVQEVAEAVHVGFTSKIAFQADINSEPLVASFAGAASPQEKPVLVTINIEKRANWMLSVEVGAWKRIVMNIFGNALKYTKSGTIDIGLRFVTQPDLHGVDRSHVCFSVKDTGIGISSEYLKYQLFTPFAQENSLSPGTGLGLSIVQQIVKSLGGTLDIQSAIGIGTLVKVFVPAEPITRMKAKTAVDSDRRLEGKTILVLRPDDYPSHQVAPFESQNANIERYRAVRRAVEVMATSWLNMRVLTPNESTNSEADFYVVDGSILGKESPEDLLELPGLTNKPTLLLSYQVRSHRNGVPKTVSYFRHPIAPQKLALALSEALATPKNAPEPTRLQPTTPSLPSCFVKNDDKKGEASPTVQHTISPTSRASLSNGNVYSTKPAVATIATTGLKPHLLLVDDNPINLKLLATLAIRLGCTYAAASDGLEAVTLFQSSCPAPINSPPISPLTTSPPLAPRPFDVVFMDISMPVLSGFEAAREIRKFERERGLRPAKIAALTGLGNEASKQEAFASGMERFFMKPVRLADVRDFLKAEEEEEEEDGGA